MEDNEGHEMPELDMAHITETDTLEREHVLKVYDAIATHFSATRYKAWPKVQAFIESLPKYAMIADVGCGNGKYFASAQRFRKVSWISNNNNNNNNNDNDNIEEETEKAYRYVVGIDSSEGLLRLAQQEQKKKVISQSISLESSLETSKLNIIPRTDLLRSDGRHTSLRGGLFDAAISIAVIHHFSTHNRRVEAIRELLRLIHSDGLILISVWAKEQPKKRSRNDASDVFIKWEMHEIHDKDRHVYHRYYHLFVQGELEKLSEEAGAVVRDSYYDKENWCVILQRASNNNS